MGSLDAPGRGGVREIALVALFFLLGAGTLFPWNAFITESGFFQRRFEGAAYENTFESAFGIAYNASNLVALAALMFVQQFLAESAMIVLPFVVTGVVFALMTALTLVDTGKPDVLFGITLLSVVLSGLLAAPMIAGCTGLSSRFSRDCASSFFSGQAFAGVSASVTSLVTTASTSQDPDFCEPSRVALRASNTSSGGGSSSNVADWDAFWFFAVASSVCFVCILAYYAVRAMERAAAVSAASAAAGEGLGERLLTNLEDDLVVGDDAQQQVSGNPFEEQSRGRQDAAAAAASRTRPSPEMLTTEERIQCELTQLPTHESWDMGTVKAVGRAIQWPCLAVLATFWVTLSVFPSVTAVTESSQRCRPSATRLQNDLFVPMLFLLFNTSDFLGRVTQARWQPFSGWQLAQLSVARAVLLPCFWLMRVKDSQLPLVLASDAFPVIISLLCGFTNGYVGTASMVHASRLVPEHLRSMASTISVTALTLGLGLGSASSFGTMKLIQG